MIGVVDCAVQAKYPNMPLDPMFAFVNSPSSIRVRNVPKRIGDWCIRSVVFNVAYPDGSIRSADCELIGGVWVGTIEGCPTTGKSENGYTIFASGTDEKGQNVTGYILGKGNVEILSTDGTISPDAPTYYVHLYDERPTTPREGDMYPYNGGYAIWQDGQEQMLGLTPEMADERYLNLNGTSQSVNQHPLFNLGISTYGENNIHAETTRFWPGSSLDILPSDNQEEPSGGFNLHGANLTGGSSGVVATIGDLTYPFADVTIQTGTGTPSLPSSAFPIAFTYGGDNPYTDQTSEDVNIYDNQLTGEWYLLNAAGGFIIATYSPTGIFTSLGDGISDLTFNGSSTAPNLELPGIVTVNDRTINQLNLNPTSATSFTVHFPGGQQTRARDFALVIDCTSLTSAPNITWPYNVFARTDDAIDKVATAGGRNVFYITEFTLGNYLISAWHEVEG